MQLWTTAVASPRHSPDFARQAESLGYDGMLVVDSQNLSGDPYVSLAMAATTTDKLGLGTGVTNPATRHPAVTATAIASVQKVSNGRAVLGIGRGDSALAHLGHASAKVGVFEQYLENLQAYLSGEEVPFADAAIVGEIAPPVAHLDLADAPKSSKINWLGNTPKVPVEVAATGPKVISAAARHADRIMFAVGADLERLRWGIETANAALDAADRPHDAIEFGAYVTVCCHPNLDIARQLGRAGTGLFARFSVMHGEIAGPVDEKGAEVLHQLHDRYDMNAHGQKGGQQTTALTDEFMDQFSIIGSPEHCIERLSALRELGLTKLAISGPSFIARSGEAKEAAALFAEKVLPVFAI